VNCKGEGVVLRFVDGRYIMSVNSASLVVSKDWKAAPLPLEERGPTVQIVGRFSANFLVLSALTKN
jgi:hypothetical protein